MKIIMSTKEFNEFAKEALRSKYANLAPDGKDVSVELHYSDVEITFIDPVKEVLE